MITSNDVKIGSWVNYMGDYSAKIIEIYSDDSFAIAVKDPGKINVTGRKSGVNLGGIRLTEDILDKIGFNKVNDVYRIHVDEITYIVLTPFPDLSFKIHKHLIYPNGSYQDFPYDGIVSFVHELQMKYEVIGGMPMEIYL